MQRESGHTWMHFAGGGRRGCRHCHKEEKEEEEGLGCLVFGVNEGSAAHAKAAKMGRKLTMNARQSGRITPETWESKQSISEILCGVRYRRSQPDFPEFHLFQ